EPQFITTCSYPTIKTSDTLMYSNRKFNDIHLRFNDDPLSGSTTYSANSLLEEFTDELALITYPSDYDNNRTCDIESDIREIEFLLYQGEDSNFKDSIDQSDHANLDDLFVDPTPEMFTDEQPPDYSLPPRFDVYPDDFLEIESDADNFDDDSFASNGEKIKEDDDLPSPDNEDKVFNPGILIHEKLVTIITRVAQEKKLAVSYASLLFENFDPPFYELLVFKEVPNSMRLLKFLSENKEKVFKPGIYTFEKSPVIHQPPQELSIQEMEDLKQHIEIRKKEKLQQQEQWAYLSTHPSKCLTSFCYDDNEDYISSITPNEPVLSTEEPENSLSMRDEHLDTILATESDEFIKSSVENLIPIPKVSSIDDDSFSINNIDYVEALPPDSELVSSEVMEIVIPEVGGIDDDILLTIKDDILREKLLNVNLLIAKIKALNANPTSSSDCKTKSSSTSLNSLLEETNTFHNSLPEFKTFCFDVEEISSGSTTTPPDISLLEYEAFYDDHVKEISSGSPTTHSDSSIYASFIIDLSINPFPPVDRSDFYEFTNELIPFISPPEYDCFLFNVEPNSRDFIKDVVEDISPTKEPKVHNALPTLQLNMKFQPSSESLFTYVIWIFLPFLVYSVNPHYLLSLRNEDTIFDPVIFNSHFSRLNVSHRCGTVKNFNTHRSHLNECTMMINGKNTPILDVPFFHFYPP
nr:hypothetical protein [Tanacetum cinerariifolium]